MTQPVLLHVFSTLAVGGPQMRFAQLVRNMPGKYRHRVFAMDSTYTALAATGIEGLVEVTPVDYVKGNLIGTLRAFRSALGKIKPDLLLTYNFGAVEWALANRFLPLCPMIDTEDGFGPEEVNGEITRRRILRKLAYSGVAAQIVPSRILERKSLESWGVSPSRVHYVPNGIDCDRFLEACAPDYLDGRRSIIATVAGLRPEKNLSRMLDAFSRVADAHDATLVIAGEGKEKERLQQYAAALGLSERVIFAGHRDPATLLQACDVFALSSDTEQMPISVVEAMAAGLPVASTDVGDTAQMVSEANRPFVSGRDAETLAAHFATLLGDSAKRRVIGAANRARAQKCYAEQVMVAAYDRLWQEAADGRIPGAK